MLIKSVGMEGIIFHSQKELNLPCRNIDRKIKNVLESNLSVQRDVRGANLILAFICFDELIFSFYLETKLVLPSLKFFPGTVASFRETLFLKAFGKV